MKIQCEQCKIEYNIDDAAIGERGIRAQCPRCNFITTIRKSQPAILDQARSKLDQAICVNCGKAMDPIPGDPIPICPSCAAQSIDVGGKTNVQGGGPPPMPPPVPRQPAGGFQVPQIGAPPVPMQPAMPPPIPPPPMPQSLGGKEASLPQPGEQVQWRIKKSPGGDVYGPFDRDLILGWIEGDKIVPSDEISRVGGAWKPAADHEDFRPAFAARYGNLANPAGAVTGPPPAAPAAAEPDRVRTTGQGRVISPRVSPPRGPFPWKQVIGGLAAVLVLGGGGWFVYTGALANLQKRFQKEPPPPPYDHTDKLVDALRAEFPDVKGTASEHLAAAIEAQKGDTVEAWLAARREYAQALSLERGSFDALAGVAEMNALLAMYDQQTNYLDESMRFSTRATERAPQNTNAQRARAASLLASGGPANYADARTTIETQLVPTLGDDPGVMAMLGRSLTFADEAKAEAVLKQAMEKAPDRLRARVELGLLYEKTARFQKALDTFKPIIEKSYLAAYRTGQIAERAGNYKEAAAAYKTAARVAEATATRPWVEAVVAYAVVQYQALGNPKEALAALAPVEKRFLDPGSQEKLRSEQANTLRLHLAIIARLTKDYERSLSMSRAILADRDIALSPPAHFNIALVSRRKGLHNDADKALDEADSPGLDNRVQSEIYLWHGLVKQQRCEVQGAESAF